MSSVGEGTHFVVAGRLVGAERAAQRATAALFVPMNDASGKAKVAADGTPIRATCGATFIDRTHAITAAHCVDRIDVPDPVNAAVDVEMIDVSADVHWQAGSVLHGAFPAYTHAAIDEGERTLTKLTCSVAVRCGTVYGPFRCPPASTAADVDIAMLQCDAGLPADREPVAVATKDAEVGSVSMFWFHEIYAAPDALEEPQTGNGNAAQPDLLQHYTMLDESGGDVFLTNFHYFGGERNQLLPLASKPWSDGRPRVRGARDGNIVWTDLFACHGSSGSGAVALDEATGRYQLLGPLVAGGLSWNGRLCSIARTLQPGERSAGYTASEFTQEVAQLAR